MLSEEILKLLAAYVDGAVSARQRKQVDRLVRKSAEARDLLELLQRDSGELRALRRQKLPLDFSAQVMRRIAEKKLSPPTPPPASKPVPAWLGGTIAAAVLLGVATASFLFFSSRNRPADTQPEAPLFTLANLDLNAEQTRVLSERLAQAKAPHLRLECQNPAAAVAGLETALTETGIQVLVPASTREALKQEKGSYLLFAENVTAAELAAVLQKVGRDDLQAGGRGAGFGQVRIHSVTADDRKQLALRLGIDARQLQPGALGQELALKTPIQGDTRPRNDKGNPAKPEPEPARPERYALVLARAGGTGDEVVSPEVWDFLKHRGLARPGTLQVIVEIRPALG
jgi:hypothetical protein